MKSALAAAAQSAHDVERPLLRFIACGAVDDGKSTLLGRLLHDAQAVLADQLEALETDSKRFGTTGKETDFALLLDGLEAEREQGITIDVAYRYFATPRRKFIIADTPGHEQFTRNMVTGASTADLAIILVDARGGLRPQTRRHSNIVRLLGIPNVVLAINKMDLIGFEKARFEQIAADYRALANEIGIERFTAVPIAARDGDNLVRRSRRMPWYLGPTIIEALEQADGTQITDNGFVMPVQLVSRPDASFRGYAGRIASGLVASGDAVRILPAGTTAHVARIVAPGGDRPDAKAGLSTMLTFSEQIDCSRGDVIVSADSTVQPTRAIKATLIWMQEPVLVPGRRYLLKLGTRTVTARITDVVDRFDPATGSVAAATGAGLNDIATCELSLDQPIAADLYARSRALGGFILIDPLTHATAAAGLIQAVATNRGAREVTAGDISWIDAPASALPMLSSIAARRLRAQGRPVAVLDEQSMASLNQDSDPSEALRRVNAVARLMRDAGMTVLIALSNRQGDFVGERLTASDITDDKPGDWII